MKVHMSMQLSDLNCTPDPDPFHMPLISSDFPVCYNVLAANFETVICHSWDRRLELQFLFW